MQDETPVWLAPLIALYIFGLVAILGFWPRWLMAYSLLGFAAPFIVVGILQLILLAMDHWPTATGKASITRRRSSSSEKVAE